ncbi:hypothetical protein H0W80_00015 [Candidatus Saccharibacteria bacterium]|nr:hypothetical protein [Candidatus Saccharibacteria bacterium]
MPLYNPQQWSRVNSGVYDYIKPQTITDILLVGSNLTGAGLTALEALGKPTSIFSNDVGTNFYLNHTAGPPGFNFGAIFASVRARGTGNAPTTVVPGDWLGGVAGLGYDGTYYTASTPAHSVPGIWQVVTGTVSAGVVERNVYIGGVTTPAIGFDTNTNLITLSYPSLMTGIRPGYTAQIANYTATANNYTIDCTTNTFTVTLPTAVGVTGQVYNIKNSGTGVITIATTSSQTIDGVTTAVLSTQYASLVVQSTGANWIIT